MWCGVVPVPRVLIIVIRARHQSSVIVIELTVITGDATHFKESYALLHHCHVNVLTQSRSTFLFLRLHYSLLDVYRLLVEYSTVVLRLRLQQQVQ